MKRILKDNWILITVILVWTLSALYVYKVRKEHNKRTNIIVKNNHFYPLESPTNDIGSSWKSNKILFNITGNPTDVVIGGKMDNFYYPPEGISMHDTWKIVTKTPSNTIWKCEGHIVTNYHIFEIKHPGAIDAYYEPFIKK